MRDEEGCLRGGRRRPGSGKVRAIAYGALLLAGVAGAGLAVWAFREVERSARVAERLGLERAASHWNEVLSLLALPGLMFCTVLSVWAAIELYRTWRAALDPYAGGRERRGPRGIHRDSLPAPPDRPRLRGPR